ncbi:MAG: sigma-54 dependent transcriptional regulator [Nitrospiraceae bacterium]
MAGRTPDDGLPSDPVLAARIEAIRALGDGHSDHVMVVGPDHRVVYANFPPGSPGAPDASAALTADAAESGTARRCYEAALNQTEPCSTCPARALLAPGGGTLTSPDQSPAPCGTGLCGMTRVFPLKSSEGVTDSVLVLFRNGDGGLAPPTGLALGAAQAVSPADAAVEKGESRAVSDLAARVADVQHEQGFGDLIGRSEPMRRLFETIRMVADSHATVLIQGESGTGKELVARTIHRLSPRRDRTLVVLDCSSLPDTLLESELFGHVKGAFTGAAQNRRGLFEEADGGTIFLDEISDTTPAFQAKLLRVIQEGEIKPVGSNRSVQVNVRVLSASNRDLFQMVKQKEFREDLYYRLAVLPLFLPPLRERREDISLLVTRFVDAASRRHRRPVRPVSSEAMLKLVGEPWPGNVRELHNLVERVVVTAKGDVLQLHDFFSGDTDTTANPGLRSVLREVTSHTERAQILDALQQVGGNRLKAARLLGISRAGLYNKLRNYGIS